MQLTCAGLLVSQKKSHVRFERSLAWDSGAEEWCFGSYTSSDLRRFYQLYQEDLEHPCVSQKRDETFNALFNCQFLVVGLLRYSLIASRYLRRTPLYLRRPPCISEAQRNLVACWWCLLTCAGDFVACFLTCDRKNASIRIEMAFPLATLALRCSSRKPGIPRMPCDSILCGQRKTSRDHCCLSLHTRW